MSIKGFHMCDVPNEVVAQCFASLRLEELTVLELMSRDRYYRQPMPSVQFDRMMSLTHLLVIRHTLRAPDWDSISKLKNLTDLKIDGCGGFTEIPSSIENLTKLERFDLDGCSQLIRLPDSIGHLTKLESLDLGDGSELVQLAESISSFSKLKKSDTINTGITRVLRRSIGFSLPNCDATFE